MFGEFEQCVLIECVADFAKCRHALEMESRCYCKPFFQYYIPAASK